MAIEKTLVLLKPCTLQRGLAGEIISLSKRKVFNFAVAK